MANPLAAFIAFVFTLSSFLTVCALPSPQATHLPARLVTQFPSLAWLENIATRPNGDLLITELTPQPILYTIINPSSSSPVVQVIHDFSANSTQSLLGITETAPDVFVLIAGTGSIGPFTLWKVDFKTKSGPRVQEITQLPGAKLPNGVANLPGCSERVLVADSFGGLVWSVDIATKQVQVAVQVPEMAPPPPSNNATGRTPVGANGIKVHDGHLYWSNSALSTVYRIKINSDGTVRNKAKVEVVAKFDVSFVDDFVIDHRGVLFAMASADNQVWATSANPGGINLPVVGDKNSSTVAGGTAGSMGRLKDDQHVLYVVTSGAGADGTVAEGGKCVAVDTRGLKI
ncbi:hypothetical protein QBC42DRAFT_337973 [Cladorrhinum samala]|uniref:SMP-30/Gluconolactonase/LRE-like region domain-containing protein n=1 Tax=Cladorrhinum samala TaxID=585594 RepID=A0AAV9HSW1_9PEZI|nr:hypothetical protein QBC42DRAFT_337973 [Cladorrhinum samala]